MTTNVRVSILVRSHKRPQAVAELLSMLLMQDHDSFEVVVVEQTPEFSREELASLEPHWSDPRVRVLRYPPLGGAKARNEGIRNARGDIVVLIDDDDLPVGVDWITQHEAHYADPDLVGLSARQVRVPGEACIYPDALRPLIRRLCMRFSPLGVPHICLSRFDEDLQPVEWIHGTNSSVRRAVALRVGLWDESVSSQEEHSFGLRFAQRRSPNEYLAWRANPTIVRRLHFLGGMEKRDGDVRKELRMQLDYTHKIVRRYYPERFASLYPLYLGSAFVRALAYVWDYDWFQEPVSARLTKTKELLACYPEVLREVRARAFEE